MRHVSAITDDTMGVDCTIAKAATINATMIDAGTPTDRDAADVTDATTNQNAETVMVEATMGCNETGMIAVQCQQKFVVEK